MADALPTADEFFGAAEPAAPTAVPTPEAAPPVAAPPPPPADITPHVDAIIGHESGGNAQAVGDSGLALGLGQMHPEVRKAYGITKTSTPEQQKAAVASYFTDLWNKHGGNADDAVSEYHLGATKYAKDRNSPDNIKYLAEHNRRVGGSAGGAQVEAPEEPPAPLPTADAFFGPASSTTTTTTTSEPAAPSPEPSTREMSVDDAGRAVNENLGLDPTSWVGKYASAVGKPATDALTDVAEVVKRGGMNSPGDWRGQLGDALKVARLVGIPAEAIGNVAFQAAQDVGLSPSMQAIIGVVFSTVGGAMTPLPGGGEGPSVAAPLRGTAATRQAAEEAASAATAATERATAAKAAHEAAVAADEAAATSAVQGHEAATAAATQKLESATAAAPSAVAPAGVTTEQGGQALAAGMEKKLADVREPVQGIYNGVAEKYADTVLADPKSVQMVKDQIGALETELGPTLSGQAKAVIGDIKEKLDTGATLTYADLEPYKAQLDSLFPGRQRFGMTPKEASLYQFKWDLRDAMRSMVGKEDRDWLEVADKLYRDEIIPRQKLVTLVRKSDPLTTIERLFGDGKTDKQAAMARTVMRDLGDDAAGSGEALSQAVFNRLWSKANGDPKSALKAYDAMNPAYRTAMGNKGAGNFFEALRSTLNEVENLPKAPKAGVSEATKVAAKAVPIAEREATRAGNAATAAAAEANAPNKLAWASAKGIEIAATEAVGRFFGVPGGGLAGAATLFIPRDKLAELLSKSETANVLARALKTPVNSAVVPVLLQQLKKAGIVPETKEAP